MYIWIMLLTMIPHAHSGPELLLKDKDQFYWYFEGAGSATIEEAGSAADGSVYTAYLYYSGSEKRTGRNVLTPAQHPRTYTGTWLTLGDTGARYEGALTLTFQEDGTASGQWTWKGVPGQ
jgi:hypothetical protein